MTVQAASALAKKANAGDVGGVFTATVMSTRQELDEYADEWNELLAASAADSIFLTWEWISAWLDAVRPDARLLVVVVRDESGRLAALAPFYYTQMRLVHLLNYRCLRVIGDTNSGAEYPDVILRIGSERRAMELVVKALMEHRGSWDCVWMPNIAGWRGALERLSGGFDGALFHRHSRPVDFSSVKLPKTHDEYLGLFGRKRRAYIRRATRNLQSNHRVKLRRCDSVDRLPEMLQTLFDLHRRHWRSVGQDGSFVRRPLMRRFYERFAPEALRRGWLRIQALEVDGVARAVQYGYVYRGAYHALQEGYDPSSFDGIGNVLRNLTVKACIEDGIQEYDFLGEYTDHKRLWRAERRVGYDLIIGRRSLKNSVLFARNVWPTGRFMSEIA